MIKKNLSSRIYHLGSKHGFTLMEILIVVVLIVIIAIAFLLSLNPMGQINKGYDGKRKEELTQLSKEYEDYYNDHGCYPPPYKLCYDFPIGHSDGTYTCHICGTEKTSPNFSPYMSSLPCDSRQPEHRYLYQVNNLDCPSVFFTYTLLANTADPATKQFCTGNNTGQTIYNWGVSSSNTIPAVNCESSGTTVVSNPSNSGTNSTSPSSLTPTQTPTSSGQSCSTYSTLYFDPFCNTCGSSGSDGPPPGPYQKCKTDHPNDVYYIDAAKCSITCIKN